MGLPRHECLRCAAGCEYLAVDHLAEAGLPRLLRDGASGVWVSQAVARKIRAYVDARPDGAGTGRVRLAASAASPRGVGAMPGLGPGSGGNRGTGVGASLPGNHGGDRRSGGSPLRRGPGTIFVLFRTGP